MIRRRERCARRVCQFRPRPPWRLLRRCRGRPRQAACDEGTASLRRCDCACSPNPSKAPPTRTAEGGTGDRVTRLRRVLPLRPLPADGRGVRLPGPTDAWTTLAGLARETSRIRLGTLVSPPPSATRPLAITVAGVDQMSGGRVELGLGAGWFEAEHTAYGIAFGDVATRYDVFAEQLAIIDGLWRTPAGQRFDFDGRHYQLQDSPALPKPVHSRGCRSSSAARGRSARRRWRPRTPMSTTAPSGRSPRAGRSSTGFARRWRMPAGKRARWRTRWPR